MWVPPAGSWREEVLIHPVGQRPGHWFVQQLENPEALGRLADAHRRALERGITNSVASCTLMVELGETIYFCAGSEKNIKLTTPDDMEIFKALLQLERR